MWRVLSVVFQGLGQARLSVSRWEDTHTLLLTDYNYVTRLPHPLMCECQCAVGSMCACTSDRGCHEDGNDRKKWRSVISNHETDLYSSWAFVNQYLLLNTPSNACNLARIASWPLMPVRRRMQYDCLGIIPPRDKALEHLIARISANHMRTQVPNTDP